jgi:hypothetical protein
VQRVKVQYCTVLFLLSLDDVGRGENESKEMERNGEAPCVRAGLASLSEKNVRWVGLSLSRRYRLGKVMPA